MEMFKKLWHLVVFTYVVGLMSGATITYVINPYVVPGLGRVFYPKGSLHVSVEQIEAQGKEVPGGVLSQLVLVKQPVNELVEIVRPQVGSHTWDSLKSGRYDVKAYINDMYVGKAENIEIKSGQETREKIVTEVAKSGVKFTVVSSDGRTPVDGAIVELFSHRGILWARYLTNADGETPEMWIARTTEEGEYYNIYVIPPEDLEGLQIGSVDKFKANEAKILYTIRLSSGI